MKMPNIFITGVLLFVLIGTADAVSSCGVLENDTVLENDVFTTGDCFVLNPPSTEQLTLDCNGYSIIGDGTGTAITDGSNTDIGMFVYNCNIDNFVVGIHLQSDVLTSEFKSNTIQNSDVGVLISNTPTVIFPQFQSNTIRGNTDGIIIDNVFEYIVVDNWITNNTNGVTIRGGPSTVGAAIFAANNVEFNTNGVLLEDIDCDVPGVYDFVGNDMCSNSVVDIKTVNYTCLGGGTIIEDNKCDTSIGFTCDDPCVDVPAQEFPSAAVPGAIAMLSVIGGAYVYRKNN